MPKKIGRGKPGKMPSFSSIVKASKHPVKMPQTETKQETTPKLKSISPESME